MWKGCAPTNGARVLLVIRCILFGFFSVCRVFFLCLRRRCIIHVQKNSNEKVFICSSCNVVCLWRENVRVIQNKTKEKKHSFELVVVLFLDLLFLLLTKSKQFLYYHGSSAKQCQRRVGKGVHFQPKDSATVRSRLSCDTRLFDLDVARFRR